MDYAVDSSGYICAISNFDVQVDDKIAGLVCADDNALVLSERPSRSK